jgi:hypothetical protein
MRGFGNMKGCMSCGVKLLFVILSMVALLTVGCSNSTRLEFKTEYQGVLMHDGQVFYGKIASMDKDYLYMTDVFYFQRQVHPQTKETINVFIKRGKEMHNPDATYINQKFVVSIEPVSAESTIAKMIKDAKADISKAKTEEPKK